MITIPIELWEMVCKNLTRQDIISLSLVNHSTRMSLFPILFSSLELNECKSDRILPMDLPTAYKLKTDMSTPIPSNLHISHLTHLEIILKNHIQSLPFTFQITNLYLGIRDKEHLIPLLDVISKELPRLNNLRLSFQVRIPFRVILESHSKSLKSICIRNETEFRQSIRLILSTKCLTSLSLSQVEMLAPPTTLLSKLIKLELHHMPEFFVQEKILPNVHSLQCLVLTSFSSLSSWMASLSPRSFDSILHLEIHANAFNKVPSRDWNVFIDSLTHLKRCHIYGCNAFSIGNISRKVYIQSLYDCVIRLQVEKLDELILFFDASLKELVSICDWSAVHGRMRMNAYFAVMPIPME